MLKIPDGVHLKDKVRRIAKLLVCPNCHSDLRLDLPIQMVVCTECFSKFNVTSLGQIDFVNEILPTSDNLDLSKERVKKRFGLRKFNFIHFLFTPTFPILLKKLIPNAIEKYGLSDNVEDLFIVNIGGGKFDFKFALNIDIRNYENVDILANAMKLPFSDRSLDMTFSRALIEHLENPYAFASELKRVSKPGSLSLHVYPLSFPIHGSPQDFFRFTPIGIERVFHGFNKLENYSTSGPFSAFCVYTAELFASIISIGNLKIKPLALYFFYVLLSPIKWFDFFFLIRKQTIAGSVNYLILLRSN
jgi:SAM-dependent methyltransferase